MRSWPKKPSTIPRTASNPTAAIPHRRTSARSPCTGRRRSIGARGSSWTTACGAASLVYSRQPRSSMPDLAAHAEGMRGAYVARAVPGRRGAGGDHMHVEAAGWYFDYAKQRVTDETLGLLLAEADAVGVGGPARCDVRGRAHQRHRGPLRAARGATDAGRFVIDGRRRRCGGRRAAGAGKDVGVRRTRFVRDRGSATRGGPFATS